MDHDFLGISISRERFPLSRRAYPPLVSEKSIHPTKFGPKHSVAKLEAVRNTLICWYGENARDLPWCRTRDPWCVLVSR
jgi:hypothetical protein